MDGNGYGSEIRLYGLYLRVYSTPSFGIYTDGMHKIQGMGQEIMGIFNSGMRYSGGHGFDGLGMGQTWT